jgi:hypothetical protein
VNYAKMVFTGNVLTWKCIFGEEAKNALFMLMLCKEYNCILYFMIIERFRIEL